MLLIGLISLLQYTAPGYIITYFFPQRGIQRAINAVLLSLLVNFYQVWLLTALGLYTTTVCWLILSAESAVTAYLWLKKPKKIENEEPFVNWFNQQSIQERNWWFFWSCALLVSGSLFLSAALPSLKGTVFGGWDAALSWNKWAIDWFLGMFPNEVFHYPQLIPANYSISYILLGTVEIEFFAHSLTFFFAFAILALFVSLALQEKNVQFIAAAAITAFLIYINEGHRLAEGLVDIPLTCMGLAAIICLYQAKEQKTLWLGLLLVATACLLKQMGIIFFIAYLILALSLRRSTLKQTALLCITGLCLFGPLYVWIEYLIIVGNSPSEVNYLFVDIHEGRTLLERMSLSMEVLFRKPNLIKALKLSSKTSLVLYITEIAATVFLFAYSLRDKFLRGVGLLLTLPIFTLWMLVYNYDFRNLNACLPLASWAFAYSLLNLPQDIAASTSIILTKMQQLKGPLISLMGLLAVAGIFYLNEQWPAERMKLSQIEQKKQLGIPHLNQKLYNYADEHGFNGGILSDYRYIWLLPEIKEYFRYIPLSLYPLDSWSKIDLLQKKYSDISYVIIPSQAFVKDDFAAEFNNRKQQDKISEIWEADGFVLLRLFD